MASDSPNGQLDVVATSAQLRATDVGVTVMAVVFVILRFTARWRRKVPIGLDDHLIVVSMFFLFANLALNLIMIDNGLGKQAANLKIENLIMIGKMLFIDEFIYLINLALIKIAILIMYCRIFDLRRFRIAAYVLSGVTILWTLVFLFICIFQCNPIPRAWDPRYEGTCLNLRSLFIGNAVPNIVTDFAILIMPIHQVWKLQIKLVQRISLVMIFLLGCFVIFASIYRITTLLQMDTKNISYTIATPTTWSHIEVSAAVVSACLPTLRPLVQLFMHSIGLGTTQDGSNSTNLNHSGFKSNPSGTLNNKAKQHPFQSLNEVEAWPSVGNDNASSDEVPLKAIRVHREVEQSRELKQDGQATENTAKYW